MDCRETPSSAPSVSWDNPASFRFRAIRWPVVIRVTSFRGNSIAESGQNRHQLPGEICKPWVYTGVLQLFFVEIQGAVDVAHEEGVHRPGEAVADGRVEVVGNGVAHASVEPHDGLALTAGGVLGKGHHLPGQALSRPVRMDGQGVDDGDLIALGGDGPAAVFVFRQLDAVEIHAAPDRAILIYAYIQGPGVEDIPGGVGGGVSAPLPACVMQTGGVLMV